MTGRLARAVGRRFVNHVRTTPRERLERQMSGWRRRVVLRQIFRVMPRRIDRAEAAGLDAVVEFRITGAPYGATDLWQLQIDRGHPRCVRDGEASPRLIVEADGVTFLQLVTGASNPPVQVLRGRVKLAGDVLFATELPKYFRVPRKR